MGIQDPKDRGEERPKRVPFRAFPYTIPFIIIWGVMLIWLGLPMFDAEDVGTQAFREASRSDDSFILHGTISSKSKVDNGAEYPSAEWVYSFGSNVLVFSEYDLGDVGDEVYVRCVKAPRKVPSVPESMWLEAKSGPLTYILIWAGMALIVTALVSIAIYRRPTKGR
jgi:hypothetical protein